MVISLLMAALLTAAPHPYNVHDQVTLARISSPAVSPDGQRLVYVLRTTDMAANRGRYDLWMVPAAGGTPLQLTRDPASDTQPVWAPDGKSIYFLSSRGGSSQVWRISLVGGEPEPVTRLPLDVGAFALSPDAQVAGHRPGGLPRLSQRRVHGEAARGSQAAEDHRSALRPAHGPPLGHLEGRAPQPRLRRPRRGRHAARPHGGHGRGQPHQALRRRQRLHLHAGRQVDRLRGAGRRARGGLEHGPGSLAGGPWAVAVRWS